METEEEEKSVTTAVSLMAAAVSDTVKPRAPVSAGTLKVPADLAAEHPQSARTATRSRPASEGGGRCRSDIY